MTGPGDFLEGDALRRMGIPEPWRLGRADRVRFHELDALNHVNNTSFLLWFETFRVAYAIRYGMAYREAGGPVLVLKSQSVDYQRPLLLDQTYVVCGRTTSFRKTSFVMDYAVFSDGPCATGTALCVLFEPDGKTRRQIPEDIRHRMIADDGATPQA